MECYCKLAGGLWQSALLGMAIALTGCNESGYITPPTQVLNSTLNSNASESHPRFSYDGRYLVFTSDRDRQRRVLLYDLQRRRLLSLAGLNQPDSMQSQADVSADGRYIVYVSEQSGKPDIFVYDRVALNTKNITKNFVGEVRNPTISGNGRFVAFEGERSGQWDIQISDRGIDRDLSLPSDLSDSDSNSPEQ